MAIKNTIAQECLYLTKVDGGEKQEERKRKKMKNKAIYSLLYLIPFTFSFESRISIVCVIVPPYHNKYIPCIEGSVFCFIDRNLTTLWKTGRWQEDIQVEIHEEQAKDQLTNRSTVRSIDRQRDRQIDRQTNR